MSSDTVPHIDNSRAPSGRRIASYPSIYRSWKARGYQVIPAKKWPSKEPDVSFKDFVGSVDRLEFRLGIYTGERNGLLLMDPTPGSGAPHLVVIDVDDLAVLPWVVETFGATPLVVSTGREGGGCHLYYRLPPGQDPYALPALQNGVLGPVEPRREKDGNSPIDLRVHSSYVVAPGSVHQSGLRYQMRWNGDLVDVADVDFLQVPVIDIATLNREMDEGRRRRAKTVRHTPSTGSPWDARNTSGKAYPHAYRDPTEFTFGPGKWQGMRVSEVIPDLEPGTYETGCPFHAGVSERSCTLHVFDGGYASLSCHSGCKTTYRFVMGGRRVSTREGGIKVLDLSAADLLSDSGHVDPSKLARVTKSYRARGRNIIVLQTAPGTGKTHVAAQGATYAKERVVGTSPTRALTAGLSRRLDVSYYEHTEGKIRGSVAVCLPSVPRVEMADVHGDDLVDIKTDLVVVDEVEASVRSLAGGHLSDQQGLRSSRHMVSLLQRSDSVLLLDADAGLATEKLIEEAKVADRTLWLRVDPAPRYSWVQHPRAGSLRVEILGAVKAGKRIGVACGSASEARAFASVIAANSTARVVVVAGDEGAPAEVVRYSATGVPLEGNDDLAELSWVNDVDVLLWSWAMGTGVDLPGKWDRVMYLGSTVPHTVPQVRQMVGRIRQLGDGAVHYYVPHGTRPQAWELDPEQVESRWYQADAAERRVLGLPPAPERVVIREGGPVICKDTLTYIHVITTAYSAERMDGRGWLRYALEEDAFRRGEQVLEVESEEPGELEKAVNQVVTEARKSQRHEAALRIATAPDAEGAFLAAIRARGPKSKEEAHMASKAAMRRFYGTYFDDLHDEARIALVKSDARGARRSQVRRGVHALASASSDLVAEVLQELDREEVSSGRTPNPEKASRRVLRGQLDVRFLDLLGLPVEEIKTAISAVPSLGGTQPIPIDSAEIGDSQISKLSAAMWRRREALGLRGIKVSKDASNPKNQRRWITAYLRSLGFTVSRKRQRVDGERVYVTVVSWGDLVAQGRAYWTALTTRGDEDTSTALTRAQERIRLREELRAKESWDLMVGIELDALLKSGGAAAKSVPRQEDVLH